MDKKIIFGYAAGVAVGNGTLTRQMKDQLDKGDVALAVKILESRKAELRQGVNRGSVMPLSAEDIDSMVASVDEAIELIQAP